VERAWTQATHAIAEVRGLPKDAAVTKQFELVRLHRCFLSLGAGRWVKIESDHPGSEMSRPTQQIRFCTSRDGTRIAFASYGAGPPLVRTAQWISHLDLDRDNPVIGPWLSLLARRHTLIRYDPRGCGLSDREDLEFSLSKQVEDLEAVIEAAGLKRFVLFGATAGGITAIDYAARHRERVSRLIVYGGFERGRFVRTAAKDTEEAELQLKATELGWGSENPAFRQIHISQLIPDATAEQSRALTELMRISMSPANAANILRLYFHADLRDIAPKVRCPTLVLHARQDAQVPFEEGRLLAGLIPGARFVSLESRNHLLLENEPAWQRFSEEIEHFLSPQQAKPSDGLLPDDLTAREHDVLELLAQGLDNGTIASKLGTSEKTVRNQVSTIFGKLGVSSRAQAIVCARDAGFGREGSG
jgi:pimeloyl-ACP methyl ester carboxylesterase/DNA-binding CsgD family transcriptional regulator